MRQLWISGQYLEKTASGNVAWNFLGIFDDIKQATDVCFDKTCFVAPAILNKDVRFANPDWEGIVYPLNCDSLELGLGADSTLG